METTFGNLLLALNQIIDGKTLSYAYCNRTMPDKLRTLQTEFRFRFSKLLTSMSNYLDDKDYFSSSDYYDYNFLKQCITNMENISKENLDWYTPGI